MTAPVTRDHLAALIRGHAGPEAADGILRAAEGWQAAVNLAARDARHAAGLQTPDDPVVTARRREVLEAALRTASNRKGASA